MKVPKEILNLLKEINSSYPKQSIAQHIAIATADYPNISILTDGEFLFALNKYKAEKDIDYSSSHSGELDRIIKEGMSLDTILDEDEDF